MKVNPQFLSIIFFESTIQNEQLTALIQMFKPKSVKDIERYLKVCIKGENRVQALAARYYKANEIGLTAVGKAAIKGLRAKQLAGIRQFLLDVDESTNFASVRRLVDEFENLNIKFVKQGVVLTLAALSETRLLSYC